MMDHDTTSPEMDNWTPDEIKKDEIFYKLVSVLVLDHSEFTSHLHTVVNQLGKFFLVFLFDLFNLIPGLIFDQLSFRLVTLIHTFDLERQGLFLRFFLFAF